MTIIQVLGTFSSKWLQNNGQTCQLLFSPSLNLSAYYFKAVSEIMRDQCGVRFLRTAFRCGMVFTTRCRCVSVSFWICPTHIENEFTRSRNITVYILLKQVCVSHVSMWLARHNVKAMANILISEKINRSNIFTFFSPYHSHSFFHSHTHLHNTRQWRKYFINFDYSQNKWKKLTILLVHAIWNGHWIKKNEK